VKKPFLLYYRTRVLSLFILLFSSSNPVSAQLGGTHTFEFLNLVTSPRIVSLGGYLTSVMDMDINNGIFNPALINNSMINKLTLNYTDYYTDISYGNLGYGFGLFDHNFVSSIKFIDYGSFVETNEFGEELGTFSAGEYVFSLGSSKMIDSLFYIGMNSKVAYSSLYNLNASAILLDFGFSYFHPRKRIITSFIIKNLGYQLDPYSVGNREPLPFEILLGISNELAHMPLRWHLTFQHLETPNLDFQNDFDVLDLNRNTFLTSVLKHFVIGAELLIHKNINLIIGYNNRRRFEMIVPDRKGLIGFSGGISVKIKRFHFNYAITSNHFSGPISTFGIVTDLKK